eukprot:TRINITY_DN6148_c0_g1_i10.p1 TRINITY_DN6148_c0_g1~~TRINITY_DN6148_c0_g1_i10.p1  ORF type:complete len:278 (-),score=70.89 TRINITY_DN6148_c0_g1_i10:248-1081(-)
MLDKEIEAASNFLEPVTYTVITKDFYEKRHVNLPIAEMGNYMVCLENKETLRDPRLSDIENLRNTEVYFGNPYKKSNYNQVTDEKALESELMQSKVPSITLLKEEELSAKSKATQKTNTLLDDEESEMKMNDIEVKHKKDVQEEMKQKKACESKKACNSKTQLFEEITTITEKSPNKKAVTKKVKDNMNSRISESEVKDKKSKDEEVSLKEKKLEQAKKATPEETAAAQFYASCYSFKRSTPCTALTIKRPRESTVDYIKYYYCMKKFSPCTFCNGQ